MGFATTLRYLKKKDASSVVVAILVALSLLNVLQIGSQTAVQLASQIFSLVDRGEVQLDTFVGRSYWQQIVTNILVAFFMLVVLEVSLRAWVWYKAKK